MAFRVIVEEVTPGVVANDPPEVLVKRYEQTVDALDMRLVMRAVNTKPRAPRVRKPKGETAGAE